MASAADVQAQIEVRQRGVLVQLQQRALTWFCYTLLIGAIALFAAIRFHLRHMPLERDGGEYAYMGQLILQGVPPYQLASNMKLPGTYAAYAAIMAVFGQTPEGIYLGLIVVTSISAIFLFLIGRRLYGPLTGSIAAASYIFFAARPGVMGLDGEATHFVNVMALAGIWLLLRAMDRRRTSLFFASGVCFGLSFLMKQPGILFGVFGGLYWLWQEWKRPILSKAESHNPPYWGPRGKNIVILGGALIAGTVLPFAVTCLIIWKAGAFRNFWFWTWTYAREYAVLNGWHQGWWNLKYFLSWAVKPTVLWVLAVAGLLSPLWSKRARAHAGFAIGFFVTSFLAVCPGLYFRPHYFIVLLPAGALCIGIAVEFAYSELQKRHFRRLAFLPLVYFVLAYVTAVYGQWKSFYRLDPVTLSWKVWKEQDFPVDVTLAEVIKARSKPGDQIGIIGSEPEICFYTHLRCATGYLYMFPLMEKQRFAKQMQQDFMRQLQAARPRFLIYEDNELAWGWNLALVENQEFFDWAWKFAHTGYRLVYKAPAPFLKLYPDYLWGDQGGFYVFERVK